MGSNKHGFVCLFYYWTLVCWGHDEADDILCFVAFGKDSDCHRLAAKQFVGTAALENYIMCFQITSELGQRKKTPKDWPQREDLPAVRLLGVSDLHVSGTVAFSFQ